MLKEKEGHNTNMKRSYRSEYRNEGRPGEEGEEGEESVRAWNAVNERKTRRDGDEEEPVLSSFSRIFVVAHHHHDRCLESSSLVSFTPYSLL